MMPISTSCKCITWKNGILLEVVRCICYDDGKYDRRWGMNSP